MCPVPGVALIVRSNIGMSTLGNRIVSSPTHEYREDSPGYDQGRHGLGR
jgi:hypothetical protein